MALYATIETQEMEGAQSNLASSPAVTFSRSPRDGSGSGEDLQWVLESLYFSNDLLAADPIVPEELNWETEPLSRLMELRSKWERQITDDVEEYLEDAEKRDLNDVARHLETLDVYSAVKVITHMPVIPTTGTNGSTRLAHNSFILVTPLDTTEPLVVDPFFREKFTIARATPVYSALLKEAIPPVVVGSLNKIRAIVCILSEKMARSFLKMGLDVPPWRRLQAALSAWPAVIPDKSVQGPVKSVMKEQKLAAAPVASKPAVRPIRCLHGFSIGQEKSDPMPASPSARGTGQLAQAFHIPVRSARAA